MRRGLQQIESIKQPDTGSLRIGSSIVVDAGLLPVILERFARDFPRAVLHVIPEDIATQQYDGVTYTRGSYGRAVGAGATRLPGAIAP